MGYAPKGGWPQTANVDKTLADTILKGGAIQTSENQAAGPKATFDVYVPRGQKDQKAPTPGPKPWGKTNS